MKLIGAMVLVLSFIGLVLSSCSTQGKQGNSVVEVVARDFNFVVTDSIPSGWNTFKFKNAGHTEHFFLLSQLPDHITYENYIGIIPGAFQQVHDSLRLGMSREAAVNLLLEQCPEWYFADVKQMGGTGILSEGDSMTVTLNLPPGTYVMECYIKEGNVFHSTLGMISPLVVTEEVSDAAPPQADVDMTLTNYRFEIDGTPERGENTFAVHFVEHPELGLGNDVHIIELPKDVDLDTVIQWLDWMNVEGLKSPAPVRFYGGVQEMPIGYTAYFSVYFEPGEYVFVAESSASKGMVKEFTVK